ncbi:von Willebrand factor type A [Beutenbergia cavernae DSM 12333]|uniref:von Willebrand factor type A n=1 Tax=Beutenbergia cavernae (strain ATCC BAA-8 / DSM 12333 / CCUG 43141 / JCM 11478 / NBRC 16432 / NCIMB 13614 / HKI 0122) TaxID=471853 RepID=C5C561_BEUC1|nr:VWA domain-containing protein [Beutenbergia cavernae]ACQ82201.1 von Willebrand factor type A [Beutenbergia cavernae DSM 12333]
MVTMHPWAIWATIGVIVVAGVVGYLTRRGPRSQDSVRWVANAGYLTQLASYRSRLSLYRIGLAVVGAVLLVGTVAAGAALARPIDRQVRNDELATRDIVLCLDVSGSMVEYDTQIIDTYLQLLDSFEGERIALSIWNSTSRTVFPLTDDYTLVREELETARAALDFDVDSLDDWSYDQEALDRLLAFIAGTEGGDGESSSLVGDGLASCGLLFDESETDRSRSIILATDNEVFGEPVYTLPEAGDFVTERGITIFGIYAGAVTSTSAAQEKEYQDVVAANGGLFFTSDDPAAVDGIIDSISNQQAVDLDATPEVVISDRPEAMFAVLAVSSAAFVLLVWRLRS